MNQTILILLLLPLLTSSQPSSHLPFKETSGIFYNKKGIAQIANSKLTLLSYMNKTHLNNAFATINTYLVKTKDICNSTLQDPTRKGHTSFRCEYSINLIEAELLEINTKREILQQLTEKLNIRKKRGLLNGMSYLLKWAFGTPDANDAQFYEDSIKALISNNRQTQTLLKSQVQVITNTIQNFNNSLYSLRSQEKAMNENIEKINSFTTQTNSYISRLEMESAVNQQITALNMLVSQINREYTKYIETIYLAENNIVSPFVITPKMLYEELKNYKNEHELVMKPDLENIRDFYKFIQLHVISTSDNIIIALRIPLVIRTKFDLFELIPLPVQHNNSEFFSYIIPQTHYLLLSQSKSQFTFLKELSDCNEYRDEEYVCYHLHATTSTSQPICEIELLSPHVEKIPSTCTTKTVKARIETWNYIARNQWIYVLHEPTTLTIMCEGNEEHMEDVVLQKTGIIHLQPHCKGYTNLFMIEATYETSKNATYYIPRMNILDDDCCILTPHLRTIESATLKPIHLTNIDLTELKYANKKLNEFDEIITKQINQPFIVTHTKWYTIALGIIVSFLVLLILLKCCQNFGCLRWLQRLCCSTTDPRQGKTNPPLIKNFVNCIFDSSSSPTPLNQPPTNEIVTYQPRRNLSVIAEPVPEISEDEETIPVIRVQTRQRTRRSTTPL
ncbi:Envelope fusion protein [Anthophora retusa]